MLRVYLTFYRSLAGGHVPFCFKVANVSPIPKTSNANSVTNVYPIYLLSLLSKVLEKVVEKHWIPPYMENVSDTKFAHVHSPGRRTTSALTLLNQHALKFLETASGAVRFLDIDFSKAFDKIFHNHQLRTPQTCNALDHGHPSQSQTKSDCPKVIF